MRDNNQKEINSQKLRWLMDYVLSIIPNLQSQKHIYIWDNIRIYRDWDFCSFNIKDNDYIRSCEIYGSGKTSFNVTSDYIEFINFDLDKFIEDYKNLIYKDIKERLKTEKEEKIKQLKEQIEELEK